MTIKWEKTAYYNFIIGEILWGTLPSLNLDVLMSFLNIPPTKATFF